MDDRLAHEFRSIQSEFGEINSQKGRRVGVFRAVMGPPPERRSTISSVLPCSYHNTRVRNLSGGSSGSTASGSSSDSSTQLDNQGTDNQFAFTLDITPCSNTSSAGQTTRGSSSTSHRKLDRTWSDNDNERSGSHKSVNSSRYKTELCRPFEESGSCKYGDKCQFAHGYHELRNLARHPKYKTELCRTFHTVGFCPYGPRCHFIHEEEMKSSDSSPKLSRAVSVHSPSGSCSPSLSPSGSEDYIFSYQTDNSSRIAAADVDSRQMNALSVNISNNYDIRALERRISGMRLSTNNNIATSFGANSNQPRLIGSQEKDIFSEITMFNSDEVSPLDNAPKASSTTTQHSTKLDNLSFIDSQAYWQSLYGDHFSQIMRSVDSSHHSPTGSDGSSISSGSNHGGSTDSLTGNVFTNWHCPVAIGQY